MLAPLLGLLTMPAHSFAQDVPTGPEDSMLNQETMVLDGAYDPFSDFNPVGPWHETWPVFCRPWECIDWIDNGTGALDVCDYLLMNTPAAPEPTWWHVENRTLMVHLDDVMPPYLPPIYMEWWGPLPTDPHDFDPIGSWHEVWPDYCKIWECFFWDDTNGNGILDLCDWLCFFDPDTGLDICMHVFEVLTDIEVQAEDPPEPARKWLDREDLNPFEPIPDPLGPWHELWPTYCRMWDCIEWIDNDNGVLDTCDYIRLDAPTAPAPTWWHVERVTVTVFIDEDPPVDPPMALEWAEPFMTDPFSPIGEWHEVWPDFCTIWMCISWLDTNGNDVVDFCDWLEFIHPDTGVPVMRHVVGVATGNEIVREDPPRRMNLDRPSAPGFQPIPDPLGPWHELWPNYCTMWECTDWIDNNTGVLDFCDYVKLENPNEAPGWWHVEFVTTTVLFDVVDPPYVPPVYLEWQGPTPPDPTDFNPLGPWHEVYPAYCTMWECVEWHDDNGSGVVDFCDWLCFIDPGGGPGLICMHVGAVTTDIEVVEQRPPCPWDCNGDDVINVLDLIELLLCFGQPGTPPCEAEDINGDGTVNVLDLIELLLRFGTACP
jgi:hypothetical protein